MSRLHASVASPGHLVIPPMLMSAIALVAATALTLGGAGAMRTFGGPVPVETNSSPVVVLAEGTSITVELGTSLSARGSRAGDPFAATIVSPVMAQDHIAIPAGARVTGHVAGTAGGRSLGLLGVELVYDRLEVGGRSYTIHGDRRSAARASEARPPSWITASIVGGVLRGASKGSVTSSLGTLGPSTWLEARHRTLGPGTRLVFRLDHPIRLTRTS